METDQDDISNFVPANYIRRQYKIEDFVTLKTIGKGTFGNVVLVYRRDDPRQVRMALKVIDKRVIRQKVKFLDRNILGNPDPVKSFRKFKIREIIIFFINYYFFYKLFLGRRRTYAKRTSSVSYERSSFFDQTLPCFSKQYKIIFRHGICAWWRNLHSFGERTEISCDTV